MAGPFVRDLRDRITVQRRVVQQSALGGSLGGWETLIASRAAKLVPLKPLRRGGDEVEADKIQEVIIYDIWVRSDSATRGITADDRVVNARNPAQVFKIRFVEDLDRRGVWICIQAELGVADG